MRELKTLDRDGEKQTFFYEYEVSDIDNHKEFSKQMLVFLYADIKKTGDFFQTTLFFNKNYMQVVMMTHNHDSRYVAKGIPEALIHEFATIFDTVVYSSKNIGASSGEYREACADKYWKRLIEVNRAKYNDKEDFYYTI